MGGYSGGDGSACTGKEGRKYRSKEIKESELEREREAGLDLRFENSDTLDWSGLKKRS